MLHSTLPLYVYTYKHIGPGGRARGEDPRGRRRAEAAARLAPLLQDARVPPLIEKRPMVNEQQIITIHT